MKLSFPALLVSLSVFAASLSSSRVCLHFFFTNCAVHCRFDFDFIQVFQFSFLSSAPHHPTARSNTSAASLPRLHLRPRPRPRRPRRRPRHARRLRLPAHQPALGVVHQRLRRCHREGAEDVPRGMHKREPRPEVLFDFFCFSFAGGGQGERRRRPRRPSRPCPSRSLSLLLSRKESKREREGEKELEKYEDVKNNIVPRRRRPRRRRLPNRRGGGGPWRGRGGCFSLRGHDESDDGGGGGGGGGTRKKKHRRSPPPSSALSSPCGRTRPPWPLNGP